MARSAAPPWLSTGCSSAIASSIKLTPMAIGRGGCVFALGTRCTCTHISSSTSSGAPMWMNDSSENKRSLTLSGR